MSDVRPEPPSSSARKGSGGRAKAAPPRRPGPSTLAPPDTPASARRVGPSGAEWALPDHLAHLAPALPDGSAGGGGVRWPAKRLSVVEMNKRVRALGEWVGREQSAAAERRRRSDALRGTLGAPAAPPGASGALLEELMEELIQFEARFGRVARS
jgi:hypothetical protein